MNTSAPFSPLAFATAVASSLGSNWTVSTPAHLIEWPGEERAPTYITRADGLKLFVSNAYKNRVEISLSRPRDASGSYPSLWADAGKVGDPVVSVNVTRSADAVAKDLARRLIPDAERVHALALAAVAQADEYASAQRRATVKACDVRAVLNPIAGAYAAASGREVKFEVEVAPEKAEAFARLVAEFFKPSAT